MPLSGRARLASRSRGPVQQVTTRQTPWAMAALCLHPWMDAPVYCVATAATKKLAHAGDEPCLDGPERSSPSIHPSTHQTGGNISRIDGGHSHVDIWPETRGLGREVCFCLRTDDLQRLVLLCLQSVTLGHAECVLLKAKSTAVVRVLMRTPTKPTHTQRHGTGTPKTGTFRFLSLWITETAQDLQYCCNQTIQGNSPAFIWSKSTEVKQNSGWLSPSKTT